MKKRLIRVLPEHLRVPTAWRGNCDCGRWLVVGLWCTPDYPLKCECGRGWYVKDGEAVFTLPPHDACLSQVTEAVFRAEGAIKDAICYYERLEASEQALVDHPDSSKTDVAYAKQGVKQARRILKGLLKTFPWKRVQ